MYYLRVLHVRIKTFEKTEEDLLRKYLYINKQLQKEIRSGNLIIFNFVELVMCGHQRKQN